MAPNKKTLKENGRAGKRCLCVGRRQSATAECRSIWTSWLVLAEGWGFDPAVCP
jgi:hypothetical protein